MAVRITTSLSLDVVSRAFDAILDGDSPHKVLCASSGCHSVRQELLSLISKVDRARSAAAYESLRVIVASDEDEGLDLEFPPLKLGGEPQEATARAVAPSASAGPSSTPGGVEAEDKEAEVATMAGATATEGPAGKKRVATEPPFTEPFGSPTRKPLASRGRAAVSPLTSPHGHNRAAVEGADLTSTPAYSRSRVAIPKRALESSSND